MLELSRSTNSLHSNRGRFDPWALAWQAADAPASADAVGVAEALAWLYGPGRGRRVPVAVIGPKRATPTHCEIAESLGRRMGELGLPLLCGGRGGVMEAASKGCFQAGGQPIGLLPDDEWDGANAYVTIPLATGIGPARNAIIARAALVLIAIGGEYGTLSEMALGLHFGRLVLTLADAPPVTGAVACTGIDEAIDRTGRRILALE